MVGWGTCSGERDEGETEKKREMKVAAVAVEKQMLYDSDLVGSTKSSDASTRSHEK